MKITKWLLGLFFLISVVSVSFFSGLYLGETEAKKDLPPQEIDFSLFWKVYHIIQEKFVNPEELNEQKLIYGAISGMVNSLEDPYTVFFNPEETEKFLADMEGEYQGVGMEIGIKKGQLQVISPFEGTPAQEAGLRPGDKIIKVGDVFTADISIEEAVALIRGEKGTKVVLTIFRKDWAEPKEISVGRDVIKIPCLKLEFKDKDIAYLKLYHFIGQSRSDFRKAAIEILNSPAKKIILDLRNNPGGYLETSVDIAGWFLEKGQVVVIEDSSRKQEREVHRANGNSMLLHYPIVVLINQGSASASEILAGALKDNRNIQLIGESSFGKGLVQGFEKLPDNSSLKVTTARWLTPKGKLINGIGLEPDIKKEMTEEDYEQGRDPQLDKAIEIIKEMR